jgi:hypothetical protein
MMMNCKQATRLLSEKQDRPLSSKEKVALKFHTLICAGCRNFDKQMDALSVFSRSYLKTKGREDSKDD